MKKVITFLGTNRQPTQYSLSNQIFSGDVFAQALRQFLEFDQMLVFVTERARSEVYPVLRALEDDRIIPVDIPIGETPGEMWDIFEKLTSQIDDNDEVTFDITHGLRSIPFLVFLAAAFLKSARQVSIKSIYYGAFELRKGPQSDPGPAPIVDLSEFVTLLDWLNASEQFRRFGNASELVSQLHKAKPDSDRLRVDETAREPNKRISQAADALENVSRSLRLILPDQVMQASKRVQKSLDAATEAIGQWARPFTVLSQQVKDSYMTLALANPRKTQNLLPSLECERRIIQWYLERDLLIQAVTVAKEWLISWSAIHAGHDNLYHRDIREEVEDVLRKASKERQKNRGSFRNQQFSTGRRLCDIPSVHNVLNLWSQLGDVRNTLLHAGKRPDQRSAETLETQAVQLCQQINELLLPDESELSE